MVTQTLAALSGHVRHRLWIFSDLQQSRPDNARRCMEQAVEDYLHLEMPCERAVYLGDATEGANLEHIREMTDMQIELLARTGLEIHYVPGNHDFDWYRANKQCEGIRLPFLEAVSQNRRWHCSHSLADFYTIREYDGYVLVLLGDHADPGGRWFTTHGHIHGDVAAYPYGREDYRELSRRISGYRKPVFTCSHYALPGGNRPSPLLARMLPLPKGVHVHFYGHAHIGDHVWAGKECYRKVSGVDGQDLLQVDVASLENQRGSAIRSTFVELYDDGSWGIYFRNHSRGVWEGSLQQDFREETPPVSLEAEGKLWAL